MESPQTETTWFVEGEAEATWTTQCTLGMRENDHRNSTKHMSYCYLFGHRAFLQKPFIFDTFSQDRKAAALSRGKDTSQLWEGFQVPVSTSQKFDLPAPSVGRQMAPSGCAGQMQRRKERSKKKMEKGRLVNQ